MTFTLHTTTSFDRNLRKFLRKHPDLANRVNRVITDLQEDPWQPHLRLHALQGNLHGFHAVRIDYSRRIVLLLRVAEREIVLMAIGEHDEVYR